MVLDFAALPPEINSSRMYAGAGSGPMVAAAAAWDVLAGELGSAASSYSSAVSGLTGGPWLGPASASMAAAAAPYVAWMSTTAEQAKQTADQARSAAGAYEAAFAATVPPPVIAQNRAQLAALVATNILGQNTPAIAANEAHYAEMWAQDATAMYGYAGASAGASALTPFTEPPQNTNPGGQGAQAAAVGQATGTSAATHSTTLSRLISTVPNTLQALASGGPAADPPAGSGSALGSAASALSFGSGGTFMASGVLFILDPLLEGPITMAQASLAAAPGSTLAGSSGSGLGGAGLSGGLGGAGVPAGLGRTGVLAGMGRAGAVGGLSVPHSWAGTAPKITPAATTALSEPTLLGLPEAEVDGLGPLGGAMAPAGLTAAAAGGGGAAGSGWAAQRAGAAAQRGGGAARSGGGARTRYGEPPSVVPQLAREAGPHGGAPAHGTSLGRGGHGGEEALSDSVREEINDLRKQIAALAEERDVLMRSAALWAKEAMGR